MPPPTDRPLTTVASTDPALLGRRLAHARTNAQLTQEKAGAAVGLSRSAIAQVETALRAVSSDELYRFAQLYGRSLDYFYEPESDTGDEDAWTVIGRMAPAVQNDEETGRAVRHLITVCQAGADLKRELELQTVGGPPMYGPREPKNLGEAIQQGTEAAEQERKRLDLGEAPIADIHEIIARENIWAASDHLPPDLSGLFFNHSSTGMVVVINHQHHPVRQRFSYAHEYAHALFDRELKVTYTSRTNSQQLIEARANAFAAAFLAPGRGVELALRREDKGQPTKHLFSMYEVANETGTEVERRAPTGSQRLTVKDAARLAVHFNVSFQVACYRLNSLGYINQTELNDLLNREHSGRLFMGVFRGEDAPAQESGGGGGTKPETDHHIVSQMLPLIVEAYQRELIDPSKVLELASQIRAPGKLVLELAQSR